MSEDAFPFDDLSLLARLEKWGMEDQQFLDCDRS